MPKPMQLVKNRWYLARYQQVNGEWETQVVIGLSWDALWKARDASRKVCEGFTPFRGEVLNQQKNLIFVNETVSTIPETGIKKE